MGLQALIAAAATLQHSATRLGTLVIFAAIVVAATVLRTLYSWRLRREHQFFEEQAWRLRRSGIRLVRPALRVWPDAQDNDVAHSNWTLDGEIKALTAHRLGRAGRQAGPRSLEFVPDQHGLFPLRRSQSAPMMD